MSLVYSAGGVMPVPLYAWEFQSSNVDYIKNLSPLYSSVAGSLTLLPTYINGKYGQAIRLTQNQTTGGANTWVIWSFSSTPIDLDSTGVTVMCWVNFNAFSGSFMSMYDSRSNVLGMSMTSSLVRTVQGFTGTQQLKNATSISVANLTGTWYHIALTYDSTSVILYRNGVAGTPVATGLTGGITINGIRIGSQGNGITPTSFAGYQCADCAIDDIRIYNTTLTSLQIKNIYMTQGMPSRTSLNSTGSGKAWLYTKS